MAYFLFCCACLFSSSAHAFFWEKKNVPVLDEGKNWVSEWVEVEIPKGLATFQVVILGSTNARVQVADLIGPDGTAYVNSGEKPLKNDGGRAPLRNVKSPERSEGVVQGTGSLIYPNNPALPAPLSGKWKFRTLSLAPGGAPPAERKVHVMVTGKEEAKKGQVRAKVYVSPGSYWDKKEGHLEGVLEATAEMLATTGLELKVLSVEVLPEAPKKPMALPQEMAAIAREVNDPEVVNIYFMPKMEFQNKPINGLACIGGPAGLPYQHSCFVSVYAAEGADNYSLDQQGKVVAHEIGHYLGLFHTKDTGYMFIGDVFDSLDDTRTEADGSNLMDPGIPNKRPSFSPMQKKMMLYSPAVD